MAELLNIVMTDNKQMFYPENIIFPKEIIYGSNKRSTAQGMTELEDFLKSPDGMYIWRGSEDISAICSLFNLNLFRTARVPQQCDISWRQSL